VEDDDGGNGDATPEGAIGEPPDLLVNEKSQAALSRNLPIIVSIIVRLVGWMLGDVAMLFVVSVTKHFIKSGWLQYVIIVPTIAIGAFVFFGYPQLKAWAAGKRSEIPGYDVRGHWAVRLLSHHGALTFIVASFIEGPIGVGWYMGFTRDPRANELTWVSAWILAFSWGALYLWFGLTVLWIVLVAFIVFLIVDGVYLRVRRTSTETEPGD